MVKLFDFSHPVEIISRPLIAKPQLIKVGVNPFPIERWHLVFNVAIVIGTVTTRQS